MSFDLPYIAGPGERQIRAAGAADRCGFEAGDFFESVPKGADLHVLKFILHDWTDEESRRILLRRCREALAPEGRLLRRRDARPRRDPAGLRPC